MGERNGLSCPEKSNVNARVREKRGMRSRNNARVLSDIIKNRIGG